MAASLADGFLDAAVWVVALGCAAMLVGTVEGASLARIVELLQIAVEVVVVVDCVATTAVLVETSSHLDLTDPRHSSFDPGSAADNAEMMKCSH